MGLALDDLVPQRDDFRHGEGNSPAHVKSSLVGASQTLFVSGGRLVLGSWQGVYLAEFDGPRTRKVMVKVVEA
jgi:secondary thiamine-phosphate synthase enzyme